MSTAANDNDQNQERKMSNNNDNNNEKETPYIRDSSAKETRETYRKMIEEALNKQGQGQDQEQ